jgi:hypothetical protein
VTGAATGDEGATVAGAVAAVSTAYVAAANGGSNVAVTTAMSMTAMCDGGG